MLSATGPTKHRKELQGTENSLKNNKVLLNQLEDFESTEKNYKVPLTTTKYKQGWESIPKKVKK